MSLLTTIPVGSKTLSLSLFPSELINEFLLATGSWDISNHGNKIDLFALRCDPEVMDSSANMETGQFVVERLRTVGELGDVHALRHLDGRTLMYGTTKGVVGVLRDGVKELPWHVLPSGATCVSLDVLPKEHQVAAAFEDGSVLFGVVTYRKPVRYLKLPFCNVPTQIKVVGEQEAIVATSNSKLHFLDTRTSSIQSSVTVVPLLNTQKQLRITTVDSDPSQIPWLFCTGDAEGLVRFWDRRNSTFPFAISNPDQRKALTSVRMHRSQPNSCISASIDGSLAQHTIEDNRDGQTAGLEEVWRMPGTKTPVPVNSLDMLDSLAVAGLDNASVLAWRA